MMKEADPFVTKGIGEFFLPHQKGGNGRGESERGKEKGGGPFQ